jgi:mono/diheme cytochrome c family protein
MRVLLRIVAIALVLLLVTVAVFVTRGYYLLGRRIDRPVPDIRVEADSGLVAHGRHVAEMRCLGCHSTMHSDSLPLGGGYLGILDDPFHLDRATLPFPNLTPAGPLATWSDGEIARAIREGIRNDGRALVFMPSVAYRGLSDEDLVALIAYLRSQPPVPNRPARRHINWFGALLVGSGIETPSVQPPITSPVPAVSPSDTLAYGGYLARSLRCRECHGHELRGSMGPDLHAYAQQYPESLFVRSVQRGRRATDGSPVNERMPTKAFRRLTPNELSALYRWLREES